MRTNELVDSILRVMGTFSPYTAVYACGLRCSMPYTDCSEPIITTTVLSPATLHTMQAMVLADVREIMDTCSLGQALDLLTAKAAEPPLMSLVERSPDLHQACRILSRTLVSTTHPHTESCAAQAT